MKRFKTDKSRKSLLIMNYAMNSSDPVFAHQIEVVRRLSSYFPKITVITNSYNSDELLPANVNVLQVDWKINKDLSNAIRFLAAFNAARRELGNYVIFSHMTEVQSALISFWTFVNRVPHFLWYAHTSKSFALRICHKFLNSIITSTAGSCPYSDSHIVPIGQGIDETVFGRASKSSFKTKESFDAITVGRIDPSKNLEKLIFLTCESDFSQTFSKLTIIGKASPGNEAYERDLRSKFERYIEIGKLEFLGSVDRKSLPKYLEASDLFIHAFEGSLDKTLVEATMLNVPVISSNLEYQREFGAWSKDSTTKLAFRLAEEVKSFLTLNSRQIKGIVETRAHLAKERHSLGQWVSSLVTLLSGGEI